MKSDYGHNLVKHSLGEYVRGDVYTNSIEGALGHFKRAVTGVYHKVSDEHVHRYLTMFAWRWNRRAMKEGERVNALLAGTKGRRLTYRKLIEKRANERKPLHLPMGFDEALQRLSKVPKQNPAVTLDSKRRDGKTKTRAAKKKPHGSAG